LKLSPVQMGAIVWPPTAPCAVFGFLGFAIVAPWTFAVTSIADAASVCPGSIDPRSAVGFGPGDLQEWKNGLIADHPLRHGASFFQMLTGLGAFFCRITFPKRLR
jgi:hypothetical protein